MYRQSRARKQAVSECQVSKQSWVDRSLTAAARMDSPTKHFTPTLKLVSPLLPLLLTHNVPPEKFCGHAYGKPPTMMRGNLLQVGNDWEETRRVQTHLLFGVTRFLDGRRSDFSATIQPHKETDPLGQGDPFVTIERHRYKRHPAVGHAEFWTESTKATGDLLDIAKGGALLRSEVQVSQAMEVTVRFTVQDYPEEFAVKGMVVRVQQDTLAVMFLEVPAGIEALLQWLEKA